jgi:hypothetical protein
METLINLKIDEPVLIVDGYVTILLHEYGLVVKQKVKQLKYRGVADADSLNIPNEYHLEILNLLKTIPEECTFTGLQLRSWLRENRERLGDKRIFRDNNWMRPISELFRKGVIFEVNRDRNSLVFKYNPERVRYILTENKF